MSLPSVANLRHVRRYASSSLEPEGTERLMRLVGEAPAHYAFWTDIAVLHPSLQSSREMTGMGDASGLSQSTEETGASQVSGFGHRRARVWFGRRLDRERLAGLMERFWRLRTIVQDQGQHLHQHGRAYLPPAGAATLRRDEDQPPVRGKMVLLRIRSVGRRLAEIEIVMLRRGAGEALARACRRDRAAST